LRAHFPREKIIHDIPESEKTCNCGQKLRKIDEVITEKSGIIPAKVYVEKHIRCSTSRSSQISPIKLVEDK
jgi:transposase